MPPSVSFAEPSEQPTAEVIAPFMVSEARPQPFSSDRDWGLLAAEVGMKLSAQWD